MTIEIHNVRREHLLSSEMRAQPTTAKLLPDDALFRSHASAQLQRAAHQFRISLFTQSQQYHLVVISIGKAANKITLTPSPFPMEKWGRGTRKNVEARLRPIPLTPFPVRKGGSDKTIWSGNGRSFVAVSSHSACAWAPAIFSWLPDSEGDELLSLIKSRPTC
jgi:hypothetical protein